MALPKDIGQALYTTPESKQLLDTASAIKSLKTSLKQEAEIKYLAENFNTMFSDQNVAKSAAKLAVGEFKNNFNREPTLDEIRDRSKEIHSFLLKRRNKMRDVVEVGWAEIQDLSIKPPFMGGREEYGKEKSPSFAGRFVSAISAPGRAMAGGLAGLQQEAMRQTEGAPLTPGPQFDFMQELEKRGKEDLLVKAAQKFEGTAGLPTPSGAITALLEGGTFAGINMRELVKRMTPARAWDLLESAVTTGKKAALEGGLMDETLAETYREVMTRFEQESLNRARAELGNVSPAQIADRAEEIKQQLLKADPAWLAIENPRLGQIAAEIVFDPLNIVNPATLAAKIPGAAGKVGKGVSGALAGGALGALGGDVGMLAGAGLGAGLGTGLARKATKGVRYMPQYDPLRDAGEEGKNILRGALMEKEKAEKIGREEFARIAAEGGEVGPKIGAAQKDIYKREIEGIKKVLDENKALYKTRSLHNIEQTQDILAKDMGLEYSVVKDLDGKGNHALMPKVMADRIDELTGLASKPAVANSFRDFHNKVLRPTQNLWRKITTIGGHVAFAIPNAITGFGLDYLARGSKALSPAHQFRAASMAALARLAEKDLQTKLGTKARDILERSKLKLNDGKTYRFAEVIDKADEVGLLGGQLESKLSADQLQRMIGQKYEGRGAQAAAVVGAAPQLAEKYVVDPFLKGTGASFLANVTENYQHLTTFIGFLDDLSDKSVAKALDLSSRASSNYNRLGTLEKGALRDVFGFYSWARFMGPKLAEAAVLEPGRLAKILQGRKGLGLAVGPSYEEQPAWAEKRSWIRDEGLVVDQNIVSKVAKFMSKKPEDWTPKNKHDFAMLFVDDPVSAGTAVWKSYLAPLVGGDPGNAAEMSEMLGPVAAAFVELAQGKKLRTGEDLDNFSDWMAHQIAKYTTEARPTKTLRNLYNVYIEGDRPDQFVTLQMRMNALRSMTGLKVYSESALQNVARTKRGTVEKAYDPVRRLAREYQRQ